MTRCLAMKVSAMKRVIITTQTCLVYALAAPSLTAFPTYGVDGNTTIPQPISPPQHNQKEEAHATTDSGTCQMHIDSNDPVKGPVRAGDDYACAPVTPPGTNTVQGCAALCCGDDRCQSFSFNAPWTLNVSYMGCVHGQGCCCLKSAVPPLEPNSW